MFPQKLCEVLLYKFFLVKNLLEIFPDIYPGILLNFLQGFRRSSQGFFFIFFPVVFTVKTLSKTSFYFFFSYIFHKPTRDSFSNFYSVWIPLKNSRRNVPRIFFRHSLGKSCRNSSRDPCTITFCDSGWNSGFS